MPSPRAVLPTLLLIYEGGGGVRPCLNLGYKALGYFECHWFLTNEGMPVVI